jgi:hypothetical protein
LRWIENGHIKAYKHPGRGDNKVNEKIFLIFSKNTRCPSLKN